MSEDYKKYKGINIDQFDSKNDLFIKVWSRLEGRPRTADFDKTLRAEVRDPLWMLTRQWQLGEFIADDVASPVFAKVQVATTRINRFQCKNGKPKKYDESIPLEARVERQQVPRSLTFSLQIGRYWLRLMDRAGMSKYKEEFIKAFPIKLPSSETLEDKKKYCEIFAHQEVWQMYAATAGRSINGLALYETILDENDNVKKHVDLDDTDIQPFREIEKKLRLWIDRQYSKPADDNDSAWVPSNMEYQFKCLAPDYKGEGEIALTADEYHQGHLDWYSFDIDAKSSDTEENDQLKPQTLDFIPASIEFGGMPNVRWWEFEDGKTHFGDIDAHTTDIAKLLLIEFGLIYANDWFLVPFEVPVGSLARVEGLAVTNNFGERIWIDAAVKGEKDDSQKWAMYNLNVRGEGGPADRSIFIPPVVDRMQESQPIEQVKLIRDEMANMVWGIESRISLESGHEKDGYEGATERLNYLMNLFPKPSEEKQEVQNDAAIKYVLETSVPENWIPFVPVRTPKTDREIQLQRASTSRKLPNSNDEDKEIYKVDPRTEIMSYYRNGKNFIHEEEVPRSGVHVSSTYQRARWHNGKVCVWLGRRKRTGRGEGSSGLKFDYIQNVNK